jgi:hypothetical protein
MAGLMKQQATREAMMDDLLKNFANAKVKLKKSNKQISEKSKEIAPLESTISNAKM